MKPTAALSLKEAILININVMLGSGILSTKPMSKLNAQIQSSGQIQYLGSPSISFSLTGSGSMLQALGC